MKISNKYLAFAIGAAAMVGVSSCQDYDNPPFDAPVATISANTTILELKENYWDDASNYIDTVRLNAQGEHVIIAGRVISNDEDGNIYKNLVIQDASAALTISIDRSNLYTDYRVGQEVVIDVTDMYIGKYSSLQQLGYPDYSGGYGWQATFMPYELFKSHSQLNGFPDIAKVDTITTTIAALSTTAQGLRQMQSQLIRLNNVHFTEGGEPFCTAHEVNTNRTLEDQDGNTIIVRTSGYAKFWATAMPTEAGDVVGILSYNGSGSSAKWQLLLRSLDDLMNFGNPTLPIGTESNPYTVDEAIAIEKGASTTAAWVKGFIVGAVKAEVTKVSSADDIEWTAPTEMNNTLVIGQTAESRDLEHCLVVSLPQGSAFRELGNLRDNPANLGKAISVYGTLASYMSTYGVTGNLGTANEFKIDGVEPDGAAIAAGNGTEASPYNPSQVVAKGTSASETGVWLKGYIVGWIDNTSQNYADENNTHFTVPATINTNVLLATTPDVTDYTKCVAVNLPNSNNIRSSINLVDNPGNLGKVVELKGSIIKYFALPGFKDVTEARLVDGGNQGTTPGGNDTPLTSLNQTFDGITSISQLQGWSLATPSGSKSWFFREYQSNSFAEVTAYNGTAGTDGFDAWLVTPALNVDAMAKKVLSFKSCVGYDGNGSLEVYVLNSADPTKATKTKLSATIPSPTGSWSDFISSGEISLSSFSGTIYVGFRYVAAAGSKYTTYRVDDVVIGEAASSGGGEPSTGGEEPTTGAGSASSPYSVEQVIALNPTTTTVIKEGVWVTGYIVGFVDTSKSSTASAENTIFGTTGAVASNLLIASTADCKDLSKCVSVQLASGSAVRKALNLLDNAGMLGKQVSVKGNIRLYVGIPGVHSPSAYAMGDKGAE